MPISFRLNGEEVVADGVDPHVSLLHFLRDRGLTGTKEGCAEGECGACAVAFVRRGPDGKTRYVGMNSCLVLLPSVDGQELVTVEGIANGDALHPVQEAMVETGGSQCGYCTPGFVVSMFSEYYRDGRVAGKDGFDPESISGNLCRCTGYRPIRDAVVQLGLPKKGDRHLSRLDDAAPSVAAVEYVGAGVPFFRPLTLKDTFPILAKHPDATLVTGGTDIVVEVNQMERRFSAIVSLESVCDLYTWDLADDALTIGAAVPLSQIEERLHGTGLLPMLEQVLPLFSSRLIRNRATLGGNIAVASPIGDSPPVLLALDARVVIASASGEREVALDQFFTGYRATVLKPGELIKSIILPRPFPVVSKFYKVSKRVMDDISTVAAGLAVDIGDDGKVTRARLAYGGVAATPARAYDAERELVGHAFDAASIARAKEKLATAFTPMSDHRGSASYRNAMVVSLLEKFAHDMSSELGSAS